MDVVEVLFEVLFPESLLKAGGKAWDKLGVTSRYSLWLRAFNRKASSQQLAAQRWDEFSPEDQAQLLLIMIYHAPLELGREIAALPADEVTAYGIGVPFHTRTVH
jgi:hypothetical protein